MRNMVFPLLLMLLLNCATDAPHSNPNDPLNPDAKGIIKGTVISIFGYDSIAGAVVTAFPGIHVDTTDARGSFRFSNLKPDTYLVTAHHDAYIDEYDTVNLEGGEEKDIQFVLNGKPVITDHSIYSVHSYSRSARYTANFTLTFFDIDAYIADSVVAESEYEKVRLQFAFAQGESVGVYEQEVAHVSIADLETLIGIPFGFWIKDLIGAYSDTVSAVLVRVLQERPQIIFPDSLDTLSIGDTLQWIPPILGNFTTFTLIKFWGFGGSVEDPDWTSDSLDGMDSLFVFLDSLKPGEYEYAIEVKDEFGNTARTIKEKIFVE
jgi:hypothetical protein